MSTVILTIKDNKVEGPICNMNIWTGPSSKHLRPPIAVYYSDTPLERKGEKKKWEVIPRDHPQLEILSIDNVAKVFWAELTDWNFRPSVFLELLLMVETLGLFIEQVMNFIGKIERILISLEKDVMKSNQPLMLSL